jgi:putative chitobiose transport system permease protein
VKYLRTISLYSVMTVFGLFALLPFVWLVSTSFKGAEELFSFPPVLWPKKFVLQNYTGVWNAVPFLAYTLNSIIIAAASVVLNVTLASLAGFALARYRFKGRNLIFLFVLATMMAPKEVTIIPLYTTILKMHLADTLTGVVLPSLAAAVMVERHAADDNTRHRHTDDLYFYRRVGRFSVAPGCLKKPRTLYAPGGPELYDRNIRR